MADSIEKMETVFPVPPNDIGVKKRRVYDKGRIAADGYIYTPYITKNGRIFWHPKGGMFKFLPS